MANYGTNLAEAFAAKALSRYYEAAVEEKITNHDYEGEIKDKASKLNILTFGALSLKNYTGSNLTADDPQESVGVLTTDQKKAYYFKIPSISKFYSWIKNPEGTLLDQVGKELKKTVDQYVLSFYSKVAAGNRIGTDYTTGTVAINSSGVVTGTGTTFTSAMVGRGFKADGHTKWYRVKTYTSATSITIEQDLDDDDATYDGGVINAGAGYTIEANTPITVTKTTIYSHIVSAKTKLDQNEIPASDRFLVVPSHIGAYLLQAPELIPAVPTAYDEVVKRGLIGQIAGFTVYQSEAVSGNATNGYRCLAGHRSAITFAMGMTETGIEDMTGNFGKAYKGLYVYGAKVVDERRKALVELFLK